MSTATLSPAPKRKSAAKHFRAASLGVGPFDSLMADFQAATYSAANPIIQTISQGTTWLPVSTDSLGPIHFYWQNGSFFNAYTWNYINNLFAYNQINNNYYTNGDGLNTALYNAFSAISYVLSSTDQATVNQAYLNNTGDMATLVSNYINGGYSTVPAGTTQAQYNYVLQQMLDWSQPSGSTMPPVSYTTFFQSPNPAALLPYAPPGAAQLIKQLIAIVNKMGAANAIIGAQQAVVSELSNVLKNIQGPVNYSTSNPTPAGWMALVDDNGPVSSCEPQWILNPPAATITTGLETGSSFTVRLTVTDIDNSTCNVSVNGGAGVSVGVGFFGINASTSASYDLSTITENITQLDVTMTFNGVTNISMVPSAYNISTSAGWWLPSILSQAVNYNSAVSGPYMPPSAYNFNQDGNFGVLNNLFISQLPAMELTFTTINADEINQIFTTTTSWGVDFLGIDFGGGSSTSTYTSHVSDYSSNSITITMAPPSFPSSLPSNDQTAFVIGASLTWPGAK
ncbi:hypothetical protein BEL04_11680 [Mucilaginibacter sp. PPCGB 2223]|uniref:hypothetical protein n=1 Tax=Mucilaginibacter sp. PPCGB 2223 TaxID=1886027 RepID=UPI000826E89C|nr:hypothetical protein [Mucilaginibacter sp. PPCGB 2223]OCX52146.1 hypothetical protein BEL04_11680 [Mucilaginibacter sp. PPCGB 2223]